MRGCGRRRHAVRLDGRPGGEGRVRRTHLARTDVVVTSACATELLFLTSLARSAPILRAASLLRRSSPRRGTRNTACTNVPPVLPGGAGRSANPVGTPPPRPPRLVTPRSRNPPGADPEEIAAGHGGHEAPSTPSTLPPSTPRREALERCRGSARVASEAIAPANRFQSRSRHST